MSKRHNYLKGQPPPEGRAVSEMSLRAILVMFDLEETEEDAIRALKAALEAFYNETLDRAKGPRYLTRYILKLTLGPTLDRTNDLTAKLPALPQLPDRIRTINPDRNMVGICLLQGLRFWEREFLEARALRLGLEPPPELDLANRARPRRPPTQRRPTLHPPTPPPPKTKKIWDIEKASSSKLEVKLEKLELDKDRDEEEIDNLFAALETVFNDAVAQLHVPMQSIKRNGRTRELIKNVFLWDKTRFSTKLIDEVPNDINRAEHLYLLFRHWMDLFIQRYQTREAGGDPDQLNVPESVPAPANIDRRERFEAARQRLRQNIQAIRREREERRNPSQVPASEPLPPEHEEARQELASEANILTEVARQALVHSGLDVLAAVARQEAASEQPQDSPRPKETNLAPNPRTLQRPKIAHSVDITDVQTTIREAELNYCNSNLVPNADINIVRASSPNEVYVRQLSDLVVNPQLVTNVALGGDWLDASRLDWNNFRQGLIDEGYIDPERDELWWTPHTLEATVGTIDQRAWYETRITQTNLAPTVVGSISWYYPRLRRPTPEIEGETRAHAPLYRPSFTIIIRRQERLDEVSSPRQEDPRRVRMYRNSPDQGLTGTQDSPMELDNPMEQIVPWDPDVPIDSIESPGEYVLASIRSWSDNSDDDLSDAPSPESLGLFRRSPKPDQIAEDAHMERKLRRFETWRENFRDMRNLLWLAELDTNYPM